MSVTRSSFPGDFLWGTATSAYQIEGAVAEDGRGPTIWDTFSHTPGKIVCGDTGDVAADHYHRIDEDVDLMSKLGVNAYRFSIAWSRLLPTGVGALNQPGVDFYRRLAERLRAVGIAPMATLYHWDLPQALADRGGWLNPESPWWFAEYAATAKFQLGDLITCWTTVNEPWCAAFLGYASGEHAPGGTDAGDGYIAAHHLVLAHHLAVAAMRRTRPDDHDRLGVVLNLIPAWPASESTADRAAADAVDAVHNRLFLDAVFDGRYPELIQDYQRRLGVADRIDVVELAKRRQSIDYLGVNYYNVNRVAHAPGAAPLPPWPGVENAAIVRPPGMLTEMSWGVEPTGLLWMLRRLHSDYPHVPLSICENGAAYTDEPDASGAIHDPQRIAYLEAHIAKVADAIAEGIDVRGYFVWSLLDNFEWAFGYSKRFGLIHVDQDTHERTIKESGYWYRDFLAA